MADAFTRRLSDKIFNAFNHACDLRQMEAAEHLLKALECALTGIGGEPGIDKRKQFGPVIEAYGRLAALRGSPQRLAG